MEKVAVSKEEQGLSYYRFYERDLAPIPANKLEILKAGPSSVPAIPFDERNTYLKGEDTDFCQIGYGIAQDGTGFVCNSTYMPSVTCEMLDWWFPWHSVGSDLRYKIWDPEDHYFARADNPGYVLDPNVPVNQKTWGVAHHIIEQVGPAPEYLKLRFMRPADFGYDESIIGTEKCGGMVCAIGESSIAAAMTHKWYAHEDGVMFESRFWIGFRITEEGKLVKALPEGVKIPVEMPMGLYAHNIKEFSNLASILPEVYAENKDNF